MRQVRRRVAAVAAAIALAWSGAVALPASASLEIVGFTWYTDGGYTKTGPSGTVIAAYATGARANHRFKLQTSAIRGAFPCSNVLAQDVNPNIRVASGAGVIGATYGPINLPIGEYELCFYEVPVLPNGHSPTATAPAYFSVV